MEPPLARLPPELLASVFERLDKEGRTLCAMTRRSWQELVKVLWPALKTGSNELLCWATKTGSVSLMKHAERWGATYFGQALKYAARGGHVDCLKQAKKWGARLGPPVLLEPSGRPQKKAALTV